MLTLKDFFAENRSAALAFSGGADSSYLLYMGKALDCDICAYYVKTEFQPAFELDDAVRLAKELGAKLKMIELSVMEDSLIAANGPRRCYHCKKKIFSAVMHEAEKDGYTVLIDGTNASDDEGDRPGMQALRELSVRSPLYECGITKSEVRSLSRDAGLFTWDKPAYACLATRIAAGTEITHSDLIITENAENALFEMGFRDFRIRKDGGTAKIQVTEDQMEKLFTGRKKITEALRPYYENVTLDLEARK